MQSAVRCSLSALPQDGWTLQFEEAAASPGVALWLVEGGAWLQACAALSDARAWQPLTVHLVVLADDVPADGVEQLMAHGAFDFLRHPFSHEDLALRLKRALGAVPAPVLPNGDWGNVRERQHVFQRAGLCEAPRLQADHIEFGDAGSPSDESFQVAKARVVEHFERSYIERLLQASEGNISHAARIAKKNRRAFFELIRKHDIDADRFRMSLT